MDQGPATLPGDSDRGQARSPSDAIRLKRCALKPGGPQATQAVRRFQREAGLGRLPDVPGVGELPQAVYLPGGATSDK